jgi:hypothetical protein
MFFALDLKTGKTLWLGEAREATNVAVTKAGDLLFLLNEMLVGHVLERGIAERLVVLERPDDIGGRYRRGGVTRRR